MINFHKIETEYPLDKRIAPYVKILVENGIETFESCQGGKGHAFSRPTIRFYGQRSEGWKALAICLENNLPVSDLFRQWSIEDGEPQGAFWQIVFKKF